MILGCGVVSAALLGAAKPTAQEQPSKSSESQAVNQPRPQAGAELLHDVAPEEQATLAALILPGIAPQSRTIWMEVTAYCPCPKCCGPHAQGLTASGKPVSYNGGHFVAADKRLFRFGAKLQIPGYADGQPVEVTDRGGAIKGNHIDVFFPTHEQAKQWGRKWIAVTVAE